MDLGTVEGSVEDREPVGADVEPVGVRPDVREVVKARTPAVGGVAVGGVDPVEGVLTERVPGGAHRDEEVGVAGEVPGELVLLEVGDDVEPPVDLLVVQTHRVEREVPERRALALPIDDRGDVEELVDGHGRRQLRTFDVAAVVDGDGLVDAGHHEAVPDAQGLVRRLNGELVAVEGVAGVPRAEALERHRVGEPVGDGGRAPVRVRDPRRRDARVRYGVGALLGRNLVARVRAGRD